MAALAISSVTVLVESIYDLTYGTGGKIAMLSFDADAFADLELKHEREAHHCAVAIPTSIWFECLAGSCHYRATGASHRPNQDLQPPTMGGVRPRVGRFTACRLRPGRQVGGGR